MPVSKYFFRPHLFNENEEWLDLLPRGTSTTLKGGQKFVPKEHELVFIKSGAVRFYCNTKLNKDMFVFIVGQNSLANINGLISAMNPLSYLVANTHTEIITFDAFFLWDVDFISKNPKFYLSMAKTISKTSNSLINRAHRTCFFDCVTRMSRVIYEITDPDYRPEFEYSQGMTQIDLASLAGMHPVTASKVLKKMRDDGLIGKITSQYIEISDYEQLKDTCFF